MLKPVLSADSHVLEPPDTYTNRLDRRFRDRAPHLAQDPVKGSVYVIPGINSPLSLALMSGLLGLVVALAGLRIILAIKPADLIFLNDVALDPQVLAWALVLCLLTGILVGLAPAITMTGIESCARRPRSSGSLASRIHWASATRSPP